MQGFSFELIELVADHCHSAKDIARLASVNRLFHAAATRILFSKITIRGPRQYASFVGHLDRFQNKGWLNHVKSIDLSSYTTRGSGWTEAKAKTIVDPNVLAKFLMGCRNLRELFVGEEMMQAFVEPTVIRAIFTGHPHLQILDFTGFCDRKFTAAMARVFGDTNKTVEDAISQAPPITLTDKPEEGKDQLRALLLDATRSAATVSSELPDMVTMPPELNRISFYMCMALSESAFFIPFFQRLAINGNRLTRLDLANTKVTSQLFRYIDPSSLTHINLQGCHGIKCCSEFMPFIQKCTQLDELNLNMDFSGAAGTNFCEYCLAHLVSMDFPVLRVLNLGGHAHMSDQVLSHFSKRTLGQLEYFSLPSTKNVTIQGLLTTLRAMPRLHYLNVSRTRFAKEFMDLMPLLNGLNASQTNAALKVIEVNSECQRYPDQFQGWTLATHGRRSYYSRDGVDPRYTYSNKLPMFPGIPTSPMTKYWSFSC